MCWVVPRGEVFVVVGLLVVAGEVALGVGDDVCGVPGDDGPDEGPLVLVGVVPAVLLDGVLLVPGPGACVALPPLQLLPTQTGALPFAGVLAVAAGVTPTVPTWTAPIEWVTSCDPPPVAVLGLLEPAELCVESPPLQVLATHTGTLAFVGAFTVTAGLMLADPI